jgi:glucosyl-dolichyl phosphate glucuronosyltransferase
MTTTPISVVIPCHTQREWQQLVGAVNSVVNQSLAPAEVVVAVDHNPALYGRAKRTFPDVNVVENAYDRGASGNRNTAVQHTSTDVVAMLDGDAYARAGWLQGLVDPFADPAVVGTGGAIIPVWRGARPAWFPDEFLWTVGGSLPTTAQTPTPARNVWSASMAVRRDAFESVGGFRVGFGKQGNRSRPEDTELCLRLAMESGGHWLFVPDAQIEHPVPAERGRFRAFLSRCYQEGRGKVEMARLLASQGGAVLESERAYLRRTLPRAVGRGLVATVAGNGTRHAAIAGAVVLGVAAAGLGGGVEALSAGHRHSAAEPISGTGEPVAADGLVGVADGRELPDMSMVGARK